MAKTMIEETREGRVTDEVKLIVRREGVDVNKLIRRIATGRVIIIRSIKEPDKVAGVGLGLTTKININIGTSSEVLNLAMESEKVKVANKWGDTLMDLSTGGTLMKSVGQLLGSRGYPWARYPFTKPS